MTFRRRKGKEKVISLFLRDSLHRGEARVAMPIVDDQRSDAELLPLAGSPAHSDFAHPEDGYETVAGRPAPIDTLR